MKARVFISCGQQTAEEKMYSRALRKYFENRGFEAYFADRIHSPEGLTTSIYRAIRASEYFVAVNLSRNKNEEYEYAKKQKEKDVGSLFVQQEIAIASFLGLEMIVFNTEGINLIGVAKYLHLNPIKISSVGDVIKGLDRNTNTRGKKWKALTKNRLYLSFNPRNDLNIPLNRTSTLSNWWHINVQNESKSFQAKHCYAYIEKIRDVSTKKIVWTKQNQKYELVWSGAGVAEINIPVQSDRDFDAFFIIHGQGYWQFQERTSSSVYRYPLLIDGTYQITYVVLSDNFPVSKIQIKVELKNYLARLISQKQYQLYQQLNIIF